VAQTLKVFMRSPTWITTAIGGKTSNAFQANDCRADEPAHQQFTFTEAQKKQFKEDPEFHLQFRKKIEAEINWMADIFTMGTNMQVDVQKDMTEQMKKRLGAGLGEELASKLIPTWPPGCRRLTPGDGYLEALVQPNVTPIFSEIKQINETSIVMQDGSKHEIDILVSFTK
jgi:hypothetical protein